MLFIHWLRNRPANAEQNVRDWPTASTLRTGAPADAESRGEDGASGVAARGEWVAPAERAVRRERGAGGWKVQGKRDSVQKTTEKEEGKTIDFD